MNVRNFIIGISTSVLIAGSVNAETYNFDLKNDNYLRFYTGFNDIQDVDVSGTADIFDFASISADFAWGFDPGWTVGAQYGYPLFEPSVPFFGNIRGEAEFSYSKAYADDIDGTATITYADGSTAAITGSGTVNGKVEVVDIYNNFLWFDQNTDFNSNWFSKVSIRPYAGFGIGFSHIEHSIEDIVGEVLGQVEKGTAIGYQLIVGADFYSFNNITGGARIVGRRVDSINSGVDGSESLGGQLTLRYNF